jgi:hypothetical protein
MPILPILLHYLHNSCLAVQQKDEFKEKYLKDGLFYFSYMFIIVQNLKNLDKITTIWYNFEVPSHLKDCKIVAGQRRKYGF